MEFWPLITNLILFFNYDVILRVHASIVCVIFRLFCDISRTTYSRTLKFTSNDAESTISYKCSVDKKSLSTTENKLYAKNGFDQLPDMTSQAIWAVDTFSCLEQFWLKRNIFLM